MNIKEIKELIPHRYPFLLVDRVEKIDHENNHIICKKCVSINEEFFCGHFPDEPVMPGVLVVEALAQAGCVLILSKEENKGKIAFFAGINKMRFLKSVFPGDVLILDVRFTKERLGIYFADVEARVDDILVAKGEIMCAIK